MFEDTTDRDKQQLREVLELDREVARYGGDSFPMLVRCFEAQWRGLPTHMRKLLEEVSEAQYRTCHPDNIPSTRVIPLWQIDAQIDADNQAFPTWQRMMMCVKEQ